MKRLNVLGLPLQLVFPEQTHLPSLGGHSEEQVVGRWGRWAGTDGQAVGQAGGHAQTDEQTGLYVGSQAVRQAGGRQIDC